MIVCVSIFSSSFSVRVYCCTALSAVFDWICAIQVFITSNSSRSKTPITTMSVVSDRGQAASYRDVLLFVCDLFKHCACQTRPMKSDKRSFVLQSLLSFCFSTPKFETPLGRSTSAALSMSPGDDLESSYSMSLFLCVCVFLNEMKVLLLFI